MSSQPVFGGEWMTCIACGKQRKSEPGVSSNWRAIALDGKAYYACPDEFPRDGSPAEEFKAAYLKLLEAIKASAQKPAAPAIQKCRQCGCTNDNACIVGGAACHWIEPDLCSACAIGASDCEGPPSEVTEEDVNALRELPTILFEIDGITGLAVMSLLQLALRHPGVCGYPKEICTKVAQALQ